MKKKKEVEHIEKDGLISARQYAMRIGVSSTRINALIKENRINKGYIEGKIDPFLANQELNKRYIAAFAEYEPDQPAALTDERTASEKKLSENIKKANSAATLLKTEKLRLEVEALKGKLVDKAAQDLAQAAMAILIRERILAVPARITDTMRAAETRHEAEMLLTEELVNALTSLSKVE